MVKIVIFFKRRSGMTVEDFQKHWRTTHAGIIVKLPGIRRYIQSHVLPSAYRKGEPVYDAVAESYFDDTQAMKALAKLPEYAAVLADEPNFIDRTTMASIIADEVAIKDAPAPKGAVKSIDFVNRRTGMAVEDFQKYWKDIHGPLCNAAEPMRRYLQNHTRRAIYESGRTPPFDGVAMAWFDSMQALRDAARTPEFARLRSDVGNFIDQDRSPFVLTTEHIILA